MEIKISVPEVVSLIKELQENPSRIFEMATMNVQKDVGEYLTNLMKAELTHILGREKYERSEGDTNHRNGSYHKTNNMFILFLGGVKALVKDFFVFH